MKNLGNLPGFSGLIPESSYYRPYQQSMKELPFATGGQIPIGIQFEPLNKYYSTTYSHLFVAARNKKRLGLL